MKRNLARASAVLLGIMVPVLTTAAPAMAKLKPDDGEVHGSSLGTGLTIFYFVVIPIGAFLIISALALLPSTLSRPRYRPGKTWDHEPQWFGGPGEETAVTDTEGTARGGASAEW